MNRWGWTNLQLCCCCRHNLYCDYSGRRGGPIYNLLGCDDEQSMANVEQDMDIVTSLSLYNHITWRLTPIHHETPGSIVFCCRDSRQLFSVANLSTEAQRNGCTCDWRLRISMVMENHWVTEFHHVKYLFDLQRGTPIGSINSSLPGWQTLSGYFLTSPIPLCWVIYNAI